MPTNQLPATIEAVISELSTIVATAKQDESPLGYFAALYRLVTISVKEHIAQGSFQDNARMEQLDVVFANRYIEAYSCYTQQQPTTQSWEVAFEKTTLYWPIVLQHLLWGMNAHINLDLGIAAAQIMQGKDLQDLQADFNKINEVLASLVQEVTNDMVAIWPFLKWGLHLLGNSEKELINFSMEQARDGAWKFGIELHALPVDQQAACIAARDARIAAIATELIAPKGWIPQLVLKGIRLGERGTVATRIEILEQKS